MTRSPVRQRALESLDRKIRRAGRQLATPVAAGSVLLFALTGTPRCGAAQTTPADSSREARPSTVQWYSLGKYGRYGYTHPGILQSVRNTPGTIAGTLRLGFRRDQLPMWGAVVISTAALIAGDEWVLDRTRDVAHAVDLPPNHPSVNVRLGPVKLVPLPTTVGSGLYFLGDGMASLGVAGGFFVFGQVTDDNRARRTASQITESLLAAGTFSQVIKHITGRQTPSEATIPRGKWQWFPSLSAYQKNVPAHDAFPSGHLAVATATVEVIARNYPERRLVRPIGYAILTAVSFAMVNNGVHWASDYPLALAIGNGVASVAVNRGRLVGGAGGGGRTSEGLGVQPLLAPGLVGLSIPMFR